MERLVEMLEYGGDFFLGFCVLCGASFVFHRSKSAALYVALAGLAFCFGTIADVLLSRAARAGAQIPMETWSLLFDAISIAQHFVFFGGLALGLRAVAVEVRR